MGGADSIFVHDLISVCLKSFERQLAQRNVRVVRQIDRTSPEILADREILRQVIDTLLAEAAAGTVDGGRVRVCLKHNSAAIMLSVKDQGAGLDAEARDAILTDAARSPRAGAHLSLHECVAAVRAMGGSLFVNSAPGKGSTFYATFPPRKKGFF